MESIIVNWKKIILWKEEKEIQIVCWKKKRRNVAIQVVKGLMGMQITPTIHILSKDSKMLSLKRKKLRQINKIVG